MTDAQVCRFLLTAPLWTPGEVAPLRTAERRANRHVTRHDFSVFFLRQKWEAFSVLAPGAHTTHGLWVVQVSGQSLLVCDVSLLIEHGSTAEHVEATTTLLMHSVCEELKLQAQPRWVGRYLLLAHGESFAADWEQGESTEFPVSDTADGKHATVRVGWGNGTITGWADLTTDHQHQIMRGTVDAQFIWADLTILSDLTLDASASLFSDPSIRSNRVSLSRRQKTAHDAALRVARHNLLRDEFFFNIQGLRRNTAEALLESWNHDEAVGRLERRLREMDQTAEQLLHLRQKKHQALVQNTLLVLGLLTITDVAVGVVSLAFTSADEEPGQGSPLRLLTFLRWANTDLVLIAPLIFTCAVAAYLIWKERNGGR